MEYNCEVVQGITLIDENVGEITTRQARPETDYEINEEKFKATVRMVNNLQV